MKIKGNVNVEAILNWAAQDRMMEVVENWQDEASKAALDGNPRRAHYIETQWIERLVGPGGVK